MSGDIWQKLGIAPTDDVSTIRRAYARQLKLIDVDRDPGEFIALRDARVQATLLIAQNAIPLVQYDQGSDAANASASPPLDRLDPGSDQAVLRIEPILAPDEPEADLLIAPLSSEHRAGEPDADAALGAGGLDDSPYDGLYQSFHQLLFPPGMDEAGSFTGAEEEAALELVEKLLRDPRLDEIGFYANAESWFGESLARSIPRSDPLLQRVTSCFGWTSQFDEIGMSPAVAFVRRRIDALAFREGLAHKSHRFNPAWRELTKPTTARSKRSWGVRRNEVLELLATVRTHYPSLESSFDWHRVALWENEAGSWFGSVRFIGFAIFLAVQIVLAIARQHGSSVPETPALIASDGPLTNNDDDIAFALSTFLGGALTLPDILDRNQTLYLLLRARWRDANLTYMSRVKFAENTRKLLIDRYNIVVPNAKGQLLVELQQLHLDQARALRLQNIEDCDNFFRGAAIIGKLPDPLIQRHMALAARTLIEVNDRTGAAAKHARFRISGRIIEETAKRAGMSPENLMQALNERGTASDRCNARIALLETALAMPEEEKVDFLQNF